MRAVVVAVVTALLAPVAHAAASEPDRSHQPAPGPAPTWAPPKPDRFKAHGLDVILVERHELPLVEMRFLFDVGAVLDPAGKEGMHAMCTDLLGEGTRTLDKNALEDKKADIAAVVDIGSGREAASLHVRVAKARVGPALDLAAQLLTEPGLRAGDLERLRAQRKGAVLQARGSATAAAYRVMAPIVYGPRHPYGHIVTEASLDAVSLDDCRKVAGLFLPEGAQLVVVGDLTKAEVKGLLDDHLASWKGKAPREPRIGPPQPAMKGTVFFVDVPGAAQSQILVAARGPSRDAPDYYATSLMAQVLGGGIPSRVVQNLRENHGYTYGAYAYFGYTRSGSLFQVASSVRTDATGPALREVMKELKGMTGKPPTDAEVDRERAGTIGALPARFSTCSRTLGSMWDLLFHGLPLDTWAKMPAAVQAVRTKDVDQAVRDHLRTKNLTVVVAGDRAKVLSDLQAIADEALFGKDGLVVLDADAHEAP